MTIYFHSSHRYSLLAPRMNLLDLPNEMLYAIFSRVGDHTMISMTCWSTSILCERYVKPICDRYDWDDANTISRRRKFAKLMLLCETPQGGDENPSDRDVLLNKDLPWKVPVMRWIVDMDDCMLFDRILNLCITLDQFLRTLKYMYYPIDEFHEQKYGSPFHSQNHHLEMVELKFQSDIINMLYGKALENRSLLNYMLYITASSSWYGRGFPGERDDGGLTWLLEHHANPLYGVLGGHKYQFNRGRDNYFPSLTCWMIIESSKCTDEDIYEFLIDPIIMDVDPDYKTLIYDLNHGGSEGYYYGESEDDIIRDNMDAIAQLLCDKIKAILNQYNLTSQKLID